jgi:dTDP-4-dehydrorhamnose 3,5-epimerase
LEIQNCDIKDIKLLKPKFFNDTRGYFFESFNKEVASTFTSNVDFVQDNESKSSFGTLRGLHYQIPPFDQAKLVRVITGKVLDIAVDIRKNSPTFGKYASFILDDVDKHQLFIPRGFAHGFIVLSDEAIFSYKVDNYYNKNSERSIKWNDSELQIDWLLNKTDILLSEKDSIAPSFSEANLFD